MRLVPSPIGIMLSPFGHGSGVARCPLMIQDRNRRADFRKVDRAIRLAGPRRSRNTATLEGEAGALTRKAIEMALGGDTVALRLCLERVYPARKDRHVTFALPPITSARDAADIAASVAEAVAGGDLTPAEGVEIAKVVDVYVRAYQTAKLNDRVERVEQMTDTELMRIIRNGSDENIMPPLLTIGVRVD